MRRLPAWLLAAAFTVVSIGAQADLFLRDDRGIDVVLPATPRRIVSLLPSITEGVCVLGACARLVATDRFSDWPASVRSLPKLGGLDEVRLEQVVALRPDVVLLSASARATDRLEALGVKVIVLESRNREDVRHMLMLLGRMLGNAAGADAAWSRIEDETRAAAARVPPAIRGERVYFEIDSTPYAAGPTSFIGESLSRLGMGNVVAPGLGAYARLNPEYVVRAQPDIVMASEQNLNEMAQRPGWSALRALQRRKTCGFGTAQYLLIVRPGPRMGEAAGFLADCLVGVAAVH